MSCSLMSFKKFWSCCETIGEVLGLSNNDSILSLLWWSFSFEFDFDELNTKLKLMKRHNLTYFYKQWNFIEENVIYSQPVLCCEWSFPVDLSPIVNCWISLDFCWFNGGEGANCFLLILGVLKLIKIKDHKVPIKWIQNKFTNNRGSFVIASFVVGFWSEIIGVFLKTKLLKYKNFLKSLPFER